MSFFINNLIKINIFFLIFDFILYNKLNIGRGRGFRRGGFRGGFRRGGF